MARRWPRSWRWIAASLLLPASASCGHMTVPRLLATGRIGEACVALRRCREERSACPELAGNAQRDAAEVSLSREGGMRSGASIRLHELTPEEMTRRLGFQVAAGHAQRTLTLGMTVTAPDPEIHVGVRDFGLWDVPELSYSISGSDDELERYVPALGGPRLVPRRGGGSAVPTDFLFNMMTAFVPFFIVMGSEIVRGPMADTAPPQDPEAPPSSMPPGRRVYDHLLTWWALPEVKAALELRSPRWHLHDAEAVRVPAGLEVTLTKGFMIAKPAAPPPRPRLRYRTAWDGPMRGYPSSEPTTQAVAVSPAGWVASMSERQVVVYDATTWNEVARDEACFAVRDGLFPVAPDRAIAACADGIGEIRMPAASFRSAVTLEVGMAALGGAHLAVAGTGKRRAFVFRIDTWEQIGTIEAGSPVTAIAVSADGEEVAVGAEGGAITVRALCGGPGLPAGREVVRRLSDVGPSALAFSPDGRRLLADDGSKHLREIDVAGGEPSTWAIDAGGTPQSARYLSRDLVVLRGSAGTEVHPIGPGSDPAGSVVDQFATECLGASPDGRLICLGENYRNITCVTPDTEPDIPSLWVELDIELPGGNGVDRCTIPARFDVPLPAGGSARERLAALAARGSIPLTSATPGKRF